MSYEKQRAEWDERAEGWDDQPEAHRYAEQAMETLTPVVDLELAGFGQRRVLDFGAGTGLVVKGLLLRANSAGVCASWLD